MFSSDDDDSAGPPSMAPSFFEDSSDDSDYVFDDSSDEELRVSSDSDSSDSEDEAGNCLEDGGPGRVFPSWPPGTFEGDDSDEDSNEESSPAIPPRRFSRRNASARLAAETVEATEEMQASVPLEWDPAEQAKPPARPKTQPVAEVATRRFELYDPKDKRIQELFPSFAIYLMHDGNFATSAEIEAMKLGEGLERVDAVYILEPAQFQNYHCSTLAPHPHCQLGKVGVDNARTAVDAENRARSNQPDRPQVKLVVVEANQPFKDAFLEVTYSTEKQALSLQPELMTNHLLNVPSQRERNNKQINWGTKDWFSSVRTIKDSLGLAKPDRFKGTTNDPMLQALVTAFAVLFGVVLSRSKTAYLDPERAREFAIPNMKPPGDSTPHPFATSYDLCRRIESFTFAVNVTAKGTQTLPKNYLDLHRDRNNDDTKPSYSDVMCSSVFLREVPSPGVPQSDCLSVRFVGLSYGKKSAGEYMDHKTRFHPIMEKCHQKHKGLSKRHERSKLEKVNDLKRLLPRNSTERKEGRFHTEIHLKKTMLYGTLADPIERFLSKFPHLKKNPKYLFGLIYCSTTSNFPQYFFQELLYLVDEKEAMIGKKLVSSYGDTDKDAIDFVFAFYLHLYGVTHRKKFCKCRHEGERGLEGEPGCKCVLPEPAWKYPVSPRYSPTHNKEATRFQIVNTINVIELCFEHLWKAKNRWLRDDPFFFYSRALHRLRQSCARVEVKNQDKLIKCGAFQVGHFLAHQILGVGIYCGIMPKELHNCAEISAGTKTHDRLMKDHGFRHDGSDGEELLKSLCVGLRLNYHEAEELVCKTLRTGIIARQQWRIGDKVGDLHRNTKQAIWRHLDGTHTEPVPLLSVEALKKADRGTNPEIYWTAVSKKLRPRIHKSRKILQPRLGDEFPVFADGDALKIQVVHYNKVIKRGPQPRTAVLEPMYDRLVRRASITVGYSGPTDILDVASPRRKRHGRHRLRKAAGSGDELPHVFVGGVEMPHHGVTESDQVGEAAPGEYHACQVRLPLVAEEKEEQVVDPPPDFPLREDYPQWGNSFVVCGIRYFRHFSDAQDYALLWSLVAHRGRYSQDKLGRQFLSRPAADEERDMPLGGYQDDDSGKVKAVKCGGRGGHRWTFDVWGRTSNKIARLVRLRQSSDAIVLYLTDQMGCCISGIVTIPSSPCLRRKIPGREWILSDPGEVAGMIAHRKMPNRKPEVRVGWLDGISSWEPVATMVKEAPHQMRQYGRLEGLQNKTGWTTITGRRHKSDFDGHRQFEVYYDPEHIPKKKPKKAVGKRKAKAGGNERTGPKRKRQKTCYHQRGRI